MVRPCCLMSTGSDHFFSRNRDGVKESLQWCFTETPTPLMWPVFIVTSDPFIEIFLQIRDRDVELFAERHTIELVENRLVETLTDTIRLRALRLGSRMINVFHGKIELIFMMLGIAAIFSSPIGQHA